MPHLTSYQPRSGPSWVEREPGLTQVGGHLARLRRRARFRWFSTLVLTVLVAVGCVVMRARQRRTYQAEVLLRVAEGDVDARTAPRPTRELREYVDQVAFSRSRLLAIIRARGLYPSHASRTPEKAIEDMREDILVTVSRNYFMVERGPDDPPRSATVSIEFKAQDPEVALVVAQELAALVVEQERGARQRLAAEAASAAADTADGIRRRLNEAQARLVSQQQALVTARTKDVPGLLVETGNLSKSVEMLEASLKDAEDRLGSMTLRRSMEAGSQGLAFEPVDTRPPRRPYLSRRRELALVGVLSALLALPLMGMAVGAFDPRLHSIEDVEALGMVPFGALPHRAGRASKRRLRT
jgi:hypothetical protein